MMGTVLWFVLCWVFVSLPSWMVEAGESLTKPHLTPLVQTAAIAAESRPILRI